MAAAVVVVVVGGGGGIFLMDVLKADGLLGNVCLPRYLRRKWIATAR